MATGFSDGTYYAVGEAMNEILEPSFLLKKTRGSRDNIRFVSNGEADIAISQFDSWSEQVSKDKSLLQKVRLLMPLYSEELHVVTSQKIKSLKELKGKRISIGADASGIETTSLLVLQTLNIRTPDVKLFREPTANALAMLKIHERDALFVVAGAPVKAFQILKKPSFRLNSINKNERKTLTSGLLQYRNATISENQYSWLKKKKIKTISVDSVLIGSAMLKDRDVNQLLRQIFANQKALENRHEKFRQLNVLKIKKLLSRNREQFHRAVVDTFKTL